MATAFFVSHVAIWKALWYRRKRISPLGRNDKGSVILRNVSKRLLYYEYGLLPLEYLGEAFFEERVQEKSVGPRKVNRRKD